MARENQGLQIALIIFFMLTIVLGVTTFWCFKGWEEAEKDAETANSTAMAKTTAARGLTEERDQVKKYLGFEGQEDLEAVTTQYTEDMEKYGGTYPVRDETLDYHKLLDHLFKASEKKNAELTDVQDRITGIEAAHARLLAQEQQQKATFETAKESARTRLTTVETTAKSERDRMVAENTGYKTQMDAAQKVSDDKLLGMEADLTEAGRRIVSLTQLNDRKAAKLEALTKETIDVPDGEIRWVNQHDQTVWINVGRADALGRQITFAVYPIDITNLTQAGKKAKIEVTQILGEHLAEARVIEDSISNPIMIGDKIHTPLWSPGDRKRFALAGFFDVDEDDKSDLHIVRNLIQMNGGSVDCWIDDEGKAHNEMNQNIRYLVLGKAPEEDVPAYTKLITRAEELGIQKIQLGDLLQQMGWKDQSPVIRFGKGANPNDFRARAPDGVPKVSTGNVSDLFRPRRPPTKPRGSGGAY